MATAISFMGGVALLFGVPSLLTCDVDSIDVSLLSNDLFVSGLVLTAGGIAMEMLSHKVFEKHKKLEVKRAEKILKESEEHRWEESSAKDVSVMVMGSTYVKVDGVEHTVIVGIPVNGSISLNDTLQYRGISKPVNLKVVKLDELSGNEITTAEEYDQVAIWLDKYMGNKLAKGEELIKVS